jgi:hypothetical protein
MVCGPEVWPLTVPGWPVSVPPDAVPLEDEAVFEAEPPLTDLEALGPAVAELDELADSEAGGVADSDGRLVAGEDVCTCGDELDTGGVGWPAASTFTGAVVTTVPTTLMARTSEAAVSVAETLKHAPLTAFTVSVGLSALNWSNAPSPVICPVSVRTSSTV